MSIHEFKICAGCGKHASCCNALVALPGPIYICDECVIIATSILASEMKVKQRIQFVDCMNDTLKEPSEIVAKWKEAEAMKEPPSTHSDNQA